MYMSAGTRNIYAGQSNYPLQSCPSILVATASKTSPFGKEPHVAHGDWHG